MRCIECNIDIPLARLKLVPSTTLCALCKTYEDDFKFRMKTVGFNDEPTIAKTRQSWDLLKKQKAVKDI